MSTIADVTEDRPSAVAPDAGGQQPAESAVLSAARAAERRSLLVPVLSTACAALIAGVLGLAVVGFNTLRDDIRSLDAKIDAQFGSLDAKIDTQIGSVRGEIGMLRNDMHAEIGSVRGEIGMLRNDMHTEIGSVRGEIGMLRNDMHTEIGMLRDDMHAEIGMLRDDMNARFGEVNAVLLDHTERLARIETTLGVEPRPVQQP